MERTTRFRAGRVVSPCPDSRAGAPRNDGWRVSWNEDSSVRIVPDATSGPRNGTRVPWQRSLGLRATANASRVSGTYIRVPSTPERPARAADAPESVGRGETQRWSNPVCGVVEPIPAGVLVQAQRGGPRDPVEPKVRLTPGAGSTGPNRNSGFRRSLSETHRRVERRRGAGPEHTSAVVLIECAVALRGFGGRANQALVYLFGACLNERCSRARVA